MKHTRILAAFLALVPALAFAQDKPAGSKPAESAQSTDAKKPGLTGQVSEEEFKKMHELKEGTPPKLDGTMIDVPKGGRAYLSLPKGAKAPMPALVVVHEWWGLNDNVKLWADRFAAEGYAALAVDLYEGTVAKTSDEAMAAMRKVDEKKAVETMRAAVAFLKTDPRVQSAKIASVGWCFGGGMSLKLALAEPELTAAVMYYGHPVTEPEKLASLRAPLLGVFGTKDKSIPPEVVKQFEDALTAAKKEHKIQSYEAEHAFANPSNPKYDEKNAAAAYEETRAFLAQHLKGGAKETKPMKDPKAGG